MQVEDTTKFGEVMLSLAMAGPTPNERQFMLYVRPGGDFKLQKQPMVRLTYRTASADEDGKLKIDLYGFDARIDASCIPTSGATPTSCRRRIPNAIRPQPRNPAPR